MCYSNMNREQMHLGIEGAMWCTGVGSFFHIREARPDHSPTFDE